MALRAGYYGIKNALLKKLQGLSDALVIKSIGDGLNLSAAGELSSSIVLPNIFSGEEVDTGWKIGNAPVYAKFLQVDTYSTGVVGAKIGEIAGTIKCYGALHSIDYSVTTTGYGDIMGSYVSDTNYFGNGVYTKKGTDVTEIWVSSAAAFGSASSLRNVSVLVFYTKPAASNNSRSTRKK